MVMVRKSTRTTLSTMGMIKKMPGPLGGMSLPRRKITPLWYSGNTLIAEARTMITSTTTTTMMAIVAVSMVFPLFSPAGLRLTRLTRLRLLRLLVLLDHERKSLFP